MTISAILLCAHPCNCGVADCCGCFEKCINIIPKLEDKHNAKNITRGH